MTRGGSRGTNDLAMDGHRDGVQNGGTWSTSLRDGGRTGSSRRAAWIVAGFLALFTPFNVYWGFGGEWGVSWVVGCDDCLPLLAVWVQQVALIAGIVVVLGRAGIWRIPVPSWVLLAGIWGMTVCFGAVALWNLVGDNTLQARLLFAPVAAVMCGLCLTVARGPVGAWREREED